MVLTARANAEAPGAFEVDLGNRLVKLMLCNPAEGTEAAAVEAWVRALLDQHVIHRPVPCQMQHSHKAKFWKVGGSSKSLVGGSSKSLLGSARGSTKSLLATPPE